MGGSVRVAEASRIDPSVDLCRRNGRVPEQLLDRPQVGATLEQVCGEAVAQRMGRDTGGQRCLAHPESEPPGDVGIGEAATALREEERLLARIAGEGVAAALR